MRIFILRGMHDRSMQSGTKLAPEVHLTDWSTAGNLSNRSAGVQIPRDICTRFGRYLYSTKGSWIKKTNTDGIIENRKQWTEKRESKTQSRRRGYT